MKNKKHISIANMEPSFLFRAKRELDSYVQKKGLTEIEKKINQISEKYALRQLRSKIENKVDNCFAGVIDKFNFKSLRRFPLQYYQMYLGTNLSREYYLNLEFYLKTRWTPFIKK